MYKAKTLLILFIFLLYHNLYPQIGFGESASCNVNAICDYPWCNQRRGVVLINFINNDNILDGGSGSLIANEKRDGRPFILTAGHLIDRNGDGVISNAEQISLQSYTFTFNYQSTNCPNPSQEPAKTFSLVGAIIHKFQPVTGGSDVALLELLQRPPGNFNVFYNGWDNSENEPDNIHMIHHPMGDIKKISYSIEKIKIKTGGNRWRLKGWTNGTMQGGSSGAPWFNENKLIIGQQMAGLKPNNPCTVVNLTSDAGRFWYSWNQITDSFGKLNSLLNPNGTDNVYWQTFTGEDACKPSYFITNANDLHTSANVNGMPIGYQNNNPIFSNPAPGTRSYDGVYMASGNIQATSNVNIQSGTAVAFYGNQVILSTGFRAISGCNFTASPQPCIGGCDVGVGKMIDSDNGEEGLSKLNTNPSFTQNSQDDIDEDIFDNNSLITLSPNMIIFPNPSIGQFTFLTSDETNQPYSIEIYDNIGRLIFSKSNILVPSIDIDLTLEAKGVYFAHVTVNDITYHKKIILH